jgi:large subunit ribosomal protein L9
MQSLNWRCISSGIGPLSSNVLRSQRRYFDWDPHVSKRDGKPAITGTKYAFVAAKIPVVLLKDVAGLGSKGEIVEVKRGFARNSLVPRGDAVYGTLWQNIDHFADPELLRRKKVDQGEQRSKTAYPFEWINNVRIEFLRSALRPGSNKLSEEVTVEEVLIALSAQEEIDLLPSQVTIQEGPIDTIGRHPVSITLNLTSGSFNYSFFVDIKDKAEVAAAERREEELREAMRMKRPEFVLGSGRLGKPTVLADAADIDDDRTEDEDSDSD